MEVQAGKNDIVLKIHINLEKRGIDAKGLIKIFDIIEKALYKSDYQDVIKYFRKVDLPKEQLIKDAVLERLRSKRHRRLKLIDSKEGSIVVYGIVTGVSVFILQKTIGESLGRGFENSKLDQNFTKFFRDIFDGKKKSVTRQLRNLFVEEFDEDVEVTRKYEDDTRLDLIEIDILESQIKEKEVIPTWDELLRNDFNS